MSKNNSPAAAAAPVRRGCRAELLHRLGLAPSWVQREALAQGLPFSETAVDNELADLVVAQLVLFNARGREYRLAGEPVARRALRELLHKPQLQVLAVGAQSTVDATVYRLGVARRTRDASGEPVTLMYELELPYPGLAGMQLVQQLMRGEA